MNLPAALVDELGVWKMAFEAAYGKTVTYGEMLRGMLDSLEDSKPAVVEELDLIVKKHPELLDRFANYRKTEDKKKEV